VKTETSIIANLQLFIVL